MTKADLPCPIDCENGHVSELPTAVTDEFHLFKCLQESAPRKSRTCAQPRSQSSVLARYLDDARVSSHLNEAVKGRSSYASIRPTSRVSVASKSISPVTDIS